MMSKIKLKTWILTVGTILLVASTLLAQNPPWLPPGQGGGQIDGADVKSDGRVAATKSRAGKTFLSGLESLKGGNADAARINFDKAIEEFLLSGGLTADAGENAPCFYELVEVVFRMEHPSGEDLGLDRLGFTCGWNIDRGLATEVAAYVASPAMQNGFAVQAFKASADEIRTLELSQDERAVDTQEFARLETAVSNRSLGFTFQVHPMVQQFINYYQGRGRATMISGLQRSGMFMRMARVIFKRVGVPENVAWLGQVESAWKPTALSWASASGLWQFIPATGERFGLRRTAYIDERNGFEKATEASARYLKFLADRYGGNWELALAAYNSGEGNVDRAIARAGAANFWLAYPYLPQETRNYVPSILATIIIANNPNQYGFGQVRPSTPLRYDKVKVPALSNLSFIAQASDTTVEYLRYLNPELRTNTTPPESYIVRVPESKGDEVIAMFKRFSPPGSDANLARAEQVPTVGVVPVTKTSSQRPAGAQPSVTVTVKAGDNLTKIARKHGVAAKDIAVLNGLSSVDAALKIGTELKIPVK